MREVSVFMQVSHPSTAPLFRLSVRGDLLIFFYEFIPGGTLRRYVADRRGLPERECRRLFFQLYGAVRDLHLQHFVVHRDIKLENCLIDDGLRLRLIDFGLCASCYQTTLQGAAGTPGYCAPEVVLGFQYSEKCDVFSLGVCLYAMRTALMPFRPQRADLSTLTAQIRAVKLGDEFSDQMADLVLKMIQPSQNERIDLLDIANHPWMDGFPRPIRPPIVPKPIIFFRVQTKADILKFRRKNVTIDQSVLREACGFLAIEEERLARQLAHGVINDETTVYYLIARPMPTLPNVCSSNDTTTPAARTARPTRRRIGSTRPLPPLPPKIIVPERLKRKSRGGAWIPGI
jgi:serine/threonine protein kinase